MELPSIVERTSSYVTIRFTERSIWNLFDDLYDAEVVEQDRKQKQQNKEPKYTKEVDAPDAASGKLRKEKRYVYDAVRPVGSFLGRFTDGARKDWHKLWRDMLLTIPRNQDATLGPYKDMAQLRLARGDSGEWPRMDAARRKDDKKCYLFCREGLAAWDDLVRFERSRSSGQLATTGLSGAVLLGVQDKNAELVPFEDRSDHALLLHFWPLAVRVFVPGLVHSDGELDLPGYVVAVPEVCDLTAFCRAFVRMLQQLDPARLRFRPAEAVISLPEQGSLEFMHKLAELAERKVIAEPPSRYISNVEFFYMIKSRNNVKTMSRGRVPPRDELLRSYSGIRNSYRNPVFQSSLLLALMRGQAWFRHFEAPLAERDWSFFIHSSEEKHRTPRTMIGFAWEAAQRFQRIEENYQKSMEVEMTTPSTDPSSVDRLVYRLVQRYVHLRALQRLGMTQDDPKTPWRHEAKSSDGSLTSRETPAYQEERRKVCSSLFLELRSRNEEDFVRHFTATLGSVAQYLPEDEYMGISSALMRVHSDEVERDHPRTRGDVKTLTLLALAAHSRSLIAGTDTTNHTNHPGETKR